MAILQQINLIYQFYPFKHHGHCNSSFLYFCLCFCSPGCNIMRFTFVILQVSRAPYEFLYLHFHYLTSRFTKMRNFEEKHPTWNSRFLLILYLSSEFVCYLTDVIKIRNLRKKKKPNMKIVHLYNICYLSSGLYPLSSERYKN
jgi:hypothetical protein